MDFSVIVPVLDEVDYIDACLGALHRQGLARERFEILVIDNGSTDGTLARLERWPDVTVLHEPTPDPYLARNRGIDAARGRILAFTDGDCQVAPDWLERLWQAFDASETDIVIGRIAYPDEASFWLKRYAEYYEAKTRWLSDAHVLECFHGHGGNMAVRAEVFARIGKFATIPSPGDTELIHRLLSKVPEASIQYAGDVVATHLEVATLRDLLPKLRRYGRYSGALQQSSSFRTLSATERLLLVLRCAREHRYGPARFVGLLAALALGAAWFEAGRVGAGRRSTA